MLGGEPDTAEHLLAVTAAVNAAWPAAALASRKLRSSGSSAAATSVASAPSMATSVSASRCRIAWNDATGRPN